MSLRPVPSPNTWPGAEESEFDALGPARGMVVGALLGGVLLFLAGLAGWATLRWLG